MAEKKHLFQVSTSKAEWDRVFTHSQRQALQLITLGPSRHPGKTFVLSRRPDHGYSLDGNGNDYKPAWIGQTALDAWAFCRLMLPGYAGIAREVLDAFFGAQRPNGFISNQLDLTNHLSPDHAFPILAETVYQVYSHTEDMEWLRQIYPALNRYIRYWFSGGTEEEPEDLPTWASASQAGLDDLPGYQASERGSISGLMPHLASPGLYALLMNECCQLISIAGLLEESADIAWLTARKAQLSAALEECWNPTSKSYRSLDAHSGVMLRPQKLLTARKNGKTAIAKALKLPGRISLEVTPALVSQSKLAVTLHGKVNAVPVLLKVAAGDFKRSPESSTAFCPTLFDSIDTVTVHGLEEGSKLLVAQPDSTLEEITQLLPLWAGAPSKEVADQLVQKTILMRYRTDQGLSAFPRTKSEGNFPEGTQVPLLWNLFIIDGLERYGYRKEASDILRSLILQSSRTLSQMGALYPAAVPGEPGMAGEPDSLRSLIPIPALLKLLGVSHWSESDMVISAMNTFFAPITVEYNRIQCTFLSTETVIQTLNGETQSVTTPPTRRILFP